MLTEKQFSGEEYSRYSRHILLPEIGEEGQKRLKDAKVLIIGAGGLGCPALLYLTAAGVGTIGIADFDIVDKTNLQRQILFDVNDIGKPKAKTAEQKLTLQNPHINFKTYSFKLTANNAFDIIKQYDIVLDGSDNFPTRYLVNDACVIVGKPLVFGSIFKFEGQVAVFNYKGGPTYRCLFPEPPGQNDAPNCSEVGVLGVLPGIIGCLQANEVIKIITKTGEPLSEKLLIFDALSLSTRVMKVKPVTKNFRIGELIDYEDFCNTHEEQRAPSDQESTSEVTMKEISVWELKKKLDNNEDMHLIDVREPFEHDICNIGGELIPLGKIQSQQDKIPKNKPVVVYCHHGNRSAKAIRILSEQNGFNNLINLQGGIHAWAMEIDTSMTTY